jgi:hypothetical protein
VGSSQKNVITMQTYQYKTESGITFKVKFNSSIYPAVKKKLGVVLEQELTTNPHNKELLAIVIFEMHKKACDDHNEQVNVSVQSLLDSLDVDEMLYIYTMVMLERGAVLNSRISNVK